MRVRSYPAVSSQPGLFEEPDPIEALNDLGAVHRWYSYVQDFPPSLIWRKLREYKVGDGQMVLDPFVGAGTTLVCAKLRGVDFIGVEANPLMAFVSRVKTTWDIDPSSTLRLAQKLIAEAKRAGSRESEEFVPLNVPQKSLNKWLNPSVQREASVLRSMLFCLPEGPVRNFLLVAFGRAAFKSSNVKLCPGVTFIKNRKVAPLLVNFEAQVTMMVEDLRLVEKFDSFGKARVVQGDSRELSSLLELKSVDFLITSPPYPGDVEYTRQTRLEMYLLGFVQELADVQRVKRMMLRSSVKNIWKDDQNETLVKQFRSISHISEQIERRVGDKHWGWDYPRMVREYFGDMLLCLTEFRKIMKPRGFCLLIVGDQTVKGVLIPVGQILLSLGKAAGLRPVGLELFRIRRSSTHQMRLDENIVILQR